MTEPGHSRIAAAVAEAAELWRGGGLPERVGATEATLAARNAFTPEALEVAINTSMARIQAYAIEAWIADRPTNHPLPVAVLNAGNVPFVGLQDLLAVVCTGHEYLGVVSSKSPHLLPAFASTVSEIHPGLPVSFTDLDQALHRSEALIATGSDTTAMHIAAAATRAHIDERRMLIRGTRFSVGILDGYETDEELDSVAHDALLNEGLGCLNTSILFVPSDLVWDRLAEAMGRFRLGFPPHRSTVEAIRQAVRLFKATRQRYVERPGAVLVEGLPEAGRPGVVVWSRYSTIRQVEEWIRANSQRLQAVMASSRIALRIGSISVWLPGRSQDPPLDWKPDGKDTIEFLRAI